MTKETYIDVKKAASKNSASPSPGKKFTERLGNLENLTQAVLWVGLATIVGVLITCCALVIDQMHFNNQTYRDQSDKTNLQIQELNLRIDALQQQIKSANATK